jgi:hypothetical protein
MWVIVAISLGVGGDTPKLKIVPGQEYRTEAECRQATQFHGSFDSNGGNLAFSVCVPKGSVQIGREAESEKL